MLLYLFLICGSAFGDELRIDSINGLAQFSRDVNNGTSFKGTTVYLDTDVDFSESSLDKFEAIGKDRNTSFVGTFDGQGYLICNLVIKLSSQFSGLFGYSRGAAIRNVMVDYTSNFKNVYNDSTTSEIYIGSLIGRCDSVYSACTIESSINMATSEFRGAVYNFLYFGGLAGCIGTTDNFGAIIENCVNINSISIAGDSRNAHVGGIVGGSQGTSTSQFIIRNCLNHGKITNTGYFSTYLDIGGIAGYTEYGFFDNCVSIGNITSAACDGSIGSIVGFTKYYANFSHCYWTVDSNADKMYGGKDSHTDISESNLIYYNETALETLNEYATENSLGGWVLNLGEASIFVYINGGKGISLYGKFIMIPKIVGDSFNGWFTDSACTTPFENNTVDNYISLYGGLNYTVQFDAVGGVSSEDEKTVTRGSIYGNLPWAIREGENQFLWWYIYDSEEMTKVTPGTKVTKPAAHTLYAAWEINIVTFDFGNGTKTSESIQYNETIVYPENPVRDGYAFSGWDLEIESTQGRDVTITALWNETKSKRKIVNISYYFMVSILPVVVISLSIALIAIYIRIKMKIDKKINTKLKKILISDGCEYSKEEMPRLITDDDIKMNKDIKPGEELMTLIKVYPPDYTRPTMKEALIKADLCEADANEIVESCYNAAKFAVKDNKLFDGFTEDDAAALAMYTYDFGSKKFESNPYRIINRSLVGRNFNNLRKASGLLYIMMTALRKLPRVTGISLYRGVRSDVNLDRDHYREGNIITWSALSSSSPDMKSIKTFLAKVPKHKKVTGTLFIIEDGWGYDIQPYSLFPGEAEILIEPDRQFKVLSVIQTESINIINLTMLDTPLALPQVFGEVREKNQCDHSAIL